MVDTELVLLKNVGLENSQQIDTYRRTGGYLTLERVLREHAPERVVDIVAESQLRGRGGAGFPCGVKWRFLPADRSETYMCVNADESEPATFNNRILMEQDPHQLLEGTILACYATQSSTAYIYLRYEFVRAYHTLERAVAEAYEAGFLGRDILGSGYSLDIYVHRGAAAYICGEETGLIESLEGKRAWPRIKPPFPAVEGVFRKPTVVNNVETLCCVVHILGRGSDWFKSIGVPADPDNPRDIGSYGPKLYCVSGHVNRPGCYELPLGIPCRELIDEYAGGVWRGRAAKAAVPGGISMGFLHATELDTRLDFSAPLAVGCLGLGTAAVTVIDDQTSMVDVLYNCCRFFAHESCGQCTPCREGTAWMLRIVERIRDGKGVLDDLDVLLQVADSMGITFGTTICGLADGAAWPVKNALDKFRDEFEEAIRNPRTVGSAAAAHAAG